MGVISKMVQIIFPYIIKVYTTDGEHMQTYLHGIMFEFWGSDTNDQFFALQCKYTLTMTIIMIIYVPNSFHLLNRYFQPLRMKRLVSFMMNIKDFQHLLNTPFISLTYHYVQSIKTFLSSYDENVYKILG